MANRPCFLSLQLPLNQRQRSNSLDVASGVSQSTSTSTSKSASPSDAEPWCNGETEFDISTYENDDEDEDIITTVMLNDLTIIQSPGIRTPLTPGGFFKRKMDEFSCPEMKDGRSPKTLRIGPQERNGIVCDMGEDLKEDDENEMDWNDEGSNNWSCESTTSPTTPGDGNKKKILHGRRSRGTPNLTPSRADFSLFGFPKFPEVGEILKRDC